MSDKCRIPYGGGVYIVTLYRVSRDASDPGHLGDPRKEPISQGQGQSLQVVRTWWPYPSCPIIDDGSFHKPWNSLPERPS